MKYMTVNEKQAIWQETHDRVIADLNRKLAETFHNNQQHFVWYVISCWPFLELKSEYSASKAIAIAADKLAKLSILE